MFAYFKSILEQDAAPIVICDLDSVIRYMNPAAVAEYHADLTGKNLFHCHKPGSVEKILRVLAWFRESKAHNCVFTSRIEKTDTDIYMIALRDDSGDLIGYYEKHACRQRDTAPFYHFSSGNQAL